jgi:hypothetical protein
VSKVQPITLTASGDMGHGQLTDDTAEGVRSASVRDIHDFAIATDDAEERLRLLQEAAKRGYVPAMFSLASHSNDRAERRHWFREAAEEGHVAAMYHVASESDDPAVRRLWLLRAAERGYVMAMWQMVAECDDIDDKLRWLAMADHEDDRPAIRALMGKQDN